jgi:5-keto 4-deoxyuronate isomerase
MTEIIRFVEKLEINTYDNKKYFVLKEYEKVFKEKIEKTKFITVMDSHDNRRTLNVSNIRDFGLVKIDKLEECLSDRQKDFVNEKMKNIIRDSQEERDKTKLHWINIAKRTILQ